MCLLTFLLQELGNPCKGCSMQACCKIPAASLPWLVFPNACQTSLSKHFSSRVVFSN